MSGGKHLYHKNHGRKGDIPGGAERLFDFTCTFSKHFDLGTSLHLASDSFSFAVLYIYGSGFYDGNDDMKNMT